ncbi:MAG: putative rane fusion protein component of efflux pump, rane anchor protein YbhG [Gemmatimonadetes bacterium]|nr:putative rane fusion protein component of efflux pump, rane anchor protein YbhG [Gemmatimonadota bacterium]
MSTAPKDRPPLRLELPALGDEGNPGAGFVKRAVGLTLGTLAGLTALALAVACLVSIHVTVKAAGSMEPVGVWPVRAQEAGTVSRVLVGTGDTVSAGRELVRLDPLALASTLDGLEAQLRASQIDVARAERAAPVEVRQQDEKVEQARNHLVTARAGLRQRMVENGMGSDPDSLLAAYRVGQHVAIDLAVAEVRAAESEVRMGGTQRDMLALERFDRDKRTVEQAQLTAQIAALRQRLGRLSLRSPTHGVVLTEQIERLPGSYVREGDQLLEVADLDGWRVNLLVRERDVHRIRLGDSVQVQVQAFNADEDERLRGSVVYVSPEPLSASPAAAAGGVPQAGGLYRVTARLDQRQLDRIGIHKFRRGYTVEGQIVTRRGRVIVLVWDYLWDRMEGRPE